MSIDYDNFENCKSVLYEYAYKQDTEYCLNKYVRNEIKLEDIIKKENYDYSKILDFDYNFHEQIENKCIFVCESNHALVISHITERNNNLSNPENVNMAMSIFSSEVCLESPLKFSLIPIVNFMIDYQDLKKVNKKLLEILEEKLNINSGYFIINVVENFFRSVTLTSFIKKNKLKIEDFRIIILQVLYALYELNLKLNNFRHNNLTTDNILICEYNDVDIQLIVGKQSFKIPKVNYLVKIWNFDNATSNDYNKTKKMPDNPYFDIHAFLNSLYSLIENVEINKKDINELIEFLDENIPEEFRYKNKIKKLDETLFLNTTNSILNSSLIITKNNFFKVFIKHNMNGSGFLNMNMNMNSMTDNMTNYSFNSSSDSATSVSSGGKRSKSKSSKKRSSKGKAKGTRKLRSHPKMKRAQSSEMSSEMISSEMSRSKSKSKSKSKKHSKSRKHRGGSDSNSHSESSVSSLGTKFTMTDTMTNTATAAKPSAPRSRMGATFDNLFGPEIKSNVGGQQNSAIMSMNGNMGLSSMPSMPVMPSAPAMPKLETGGMLNNSAMGGLDMNALQGMGNMPMQQFSQGMPQMPPMGMNMGAEMALGQGMPSMMGMPPMGNMAGLPSMMGMPQMMGMQMGGENKNKKVAPVQSAVSQFNAPTMTGGKYPEETLLEKERFFF